ncbi:MAG TPA: hypothetical protein VE973_03295 [Candidatus Limnocylindria bacterium]|nr:hypothetical protein [Candidatus Limnocylindria bacterium]
MKIKNWLHFLKNILLKISNNGKLLAHVYISSLILKNKPKKCCAFKEQSKRPLHPHKKIGGNSKGKQPALYKKINPVSSPEGEKAEKGIYERRYNKAYANASSTKRF